MKNRFIQTLFLILLMFASCKSLDPIISYTKLSNKSLNKVYIYENKVPLNSTINILKKNGNNENITRSKYINDKIYFQLKEKFKNDTIQKKWFDKDFIKFNYKIITNDFIALKNNNSELFKNKKILFAFSDPINISKKKVLFYASKSNTLGSSNFSGIVIMEKIKNKWTIIETIESKELN